MTPNNSPRSTGGHSIPPFMVLKSTCERACHERHACAKGYKQMLATTTVSQMMAVWRANWEDIVDSKFADILSAELPSLYPSLREEMNASGIFLNECPDDADRAVRVLVTATDTPIRISGSAQAYILGVAHVVAHDHAQVYNTKYDAVVTLYDYSYGNIQSGKVYAYDHSSLNCSCDAILDGAVSCHAQGGTITAKRYRSLTYPADSSCVLSHPLSSSPFPSL